jgi:hypothetical protein
LQERRLRATFAFVKFEEGDTMTKADDILAFFCVSAFFAGLIIAVATLPV